MKTESEHNNLSSAMVTNGQKNRSKYNNSMFHLPQDSNFIKSTFKNTKFS